MLIIWGAGGHGRTVLDAARAMGQFESILLADDDPPEDSPGSTRILPIQDALRQFGPGTGFVVAVGDNTTRAQVYARAQAAGWVPQVVAHPSSVVAPSAQVGRGSVILPRAVVNSGSRIGSDCIINTGVIVEHDCRVGNHVHISPAAVLGGGVTLGHFVHVGLGGIILPCVSIGDRAVVGAGSVVTQPVPIATTVIGIPARILHAA